MSMIASTFSLQSPFLIGDLLFSSGKGKEDFLFPTHGESMHTDSSDPNELKPDELLQKLYVLKENICIALAGWENEMRDLLVELKITLSYYERITRDIMHQVLQNYDMENEFAGSAFMMLVIEKDENGDFQVGRYYRGKWEEIDHITFGSVLACASGRHDFIEHLHHPFTFVTSFGEDDLRSRLTANLIMLSQWIAAEKYNGRNLDNHWGAGYEMIYFDGERFRKVDEIAYVVFETVMKEDGSMQRLHPSVINYYRYHGDVLFLYSFRLFKGTLTEDLKTNRLLMETEQGDYEPHLFIVPPIDVLPDSLPEIPLDHSFVTRHVAAGMIVYYENDTDNTFRPAAYLESNEVGLKYTFNGKLEINFSLEIHNNVEQNARMVMNSKTGKILKT